MSDGSSNTLRLNLGSGHAKLDGYVNLDIKDGVDVRKLPYDDNSVDEVRASHVLEHFGWALIQPVVSEWVRVLKPDGVLRISVPDMAKIAKLYSEGTAEPWYAYLMGSQTDEYDLHHSCFDRGMLAAIMTQSGLSKIDEWQGTPQDCSGYAISLNLQGVKGYRRGLIQPRKLERVQAVMSAPNLGHFGNFFSCIRGFLTCGVQLTKLSGVFWGQVLAEAIRQQLGKCDYIFTCDYDTFFDHEQVISLYDMIVAHPEADAICAVQMKREEDTPLMTAIGGDGGWRRYANANEFLTEITPLATGHFGLTILRASRFETLKKPWFLHHPGPDGNYGQGRIDEDIHFWQNWRECGYTLYQANKIVVGHIQPMVTWPDGHFKPVHQYLTDAETSGMPASVRRVA